MAAGVGWERLWFRNAYWRQAHLAIHSFATHCSRLAFKGLAIIAYLLSLLLRLPGFNKIEHLIAWFVTEHRSWFIFIIIPASLVFDAYMFLRAWMTVQFFSDPVLHIKRVSEVQEHVKRAVVRNPRAKLCTARSGWEGITMGYRPYKNVSSRIPIHMYDILKLDTTNRTVAVEPMVSMGQLSRYLVPRGYTLEVLPEMDDLTVGGLYMGVGIETSSHKYGLFSDTVVEAAIVTANGSLLICSRTENADLFDALPWSYGTLGFLVRLTLRIIPCSPYVRIDYLPYKNNDAVTALQQLCSPNDPHSPDFIEALQFSSHEAVVMVGYWATSEDVARGASRGVQVNHQGRWYKPWFYLHVKKFLQGSSASGKVVHSEFLPIRDYYHRHTRSIFWELDLIMPIAKYWPFRVLWGWAIPPKVSFLKLTQTERLRQMYERQHVVQDMLVPMTEMRAALQEFDDAYGIYPLWICPYRAYDYSSQPEGHRSFLRKPRDVLADASGAVFEMYVDLGAYGVPRRVWEKKSFDHVAVGRRVEQFVASKRGFQMLYADVWMTPQEFRGMFDHAHYEAMKRRYDPNSNFPTVFDKVGKMAPAWSPLQASS